MAKPIATRYWSKVVKAEGCWSWSASKIGGYGRLGSKGTTVYAHRVSYEIHKGPIPDGMHVDHICRTRECTNPDHLRLVTNKQNHEHLALDKDCKSGYRGVFWVARTRRWKATVKHDRKSHHVGYFDDLEDAAAAVRAKRNELFTHNELDRQTS
jgi:hypothetical protein